MADDKAHSDPPGNDPSEAYREMGGSQGPMPGIDFNIIVLSLSTQAMMQMGEGPEAGSVPVNLPMARQTIDMLGILETKTKGNLTGEEERLLQQVLVDLRLRYVSKCKASPDCS